MLFGIRRSTLRFPLVLAGALLSLLLVTAACGGSDDAVDVAVDDSASDSAAAPEADASEASDTGTSDTDDAPVDDDADDGDADEAADGDDGDNAAAADGETASDAGDGAEAEPSPGDARFETTKQLVGQILAGGAQTNALDGIAGCVDAEAQELPVLDAMIDRLMGEPGAIEDGELFALVSALNGCATPDEMGEWMAGNLGAGPQDSPDVRACLAAVFAGDDGDDIAATITTRTFGRSVPEELHPGAIATLTDCVPVSLLAPQFALQAESQSGSAIVVDRECLTASLGEPGVAETFWSDVIGAEVDPVASLSQAIDGCADDPWGDLASEVPADFTPWSGTGALASVRPPARNAAYAEAPPMVIDPGNSYEAVITTGGGEIRIQLFPETAPITVNNFVSLARDGYFDGTIFHRVIDEFMAQAGDPTGTGTGGPGYQFADEVDDGPALDRAGLLAMANAGPGTNGSQFFITYAPTDWLTGLHTVFGEVIEGQDVADAVERRDPAAPSGRGQVVESIVIIEN